MIELVKVSKVFNQGQHNEFAAVREVSAVIETGRVTVRPSTSDACVTWPESS